MEMLATLHEALVMYDLLASEGTTIRVIDAYSIKPLDADTLRRAAADTGNLITVEDHIAEGGLGEAVASALAGERVRIRSLAVGSMPKSGKPEELLRFEKIVRLAIVESVQRLLA
jgi:transketolase